MTALLGIDVGTSAVKAVVISGRGEVLGTGSAPLAASSPAPRWSEQDPRDWWGATVAAVRAAITDGRSGDVAGIGLSGQMHGLVLLPSGDRDAQPLRPAILWNDQRTSDQCERIELALGSRRAVVEQTGNAPLPGFTAPKLLWVREHEPATFDATRIFLMPKDFVRLRLTGRPGTDVGDAAGTLLYDPAARAWNTHVCAALGVDPALLPRVFESGALAGTLHSAAATELGLAAGIPVAAGSGDNMAAAAGAGAVRPGQVVASIGTSGVIVVHTGAPSADLSHDPPGRTHLMCAADGTSEAPGQWCITGCTLSAGGALSWARDVLAPGASYDELMADAAAAPPGCEGLVFLPYLTGERCPHPDPRARGAWIGLTSRHTRGHLIRSVVEGVCFTLAQILGIVRELGVAPSEVRLSGGAARSPLWRDTLAASLGTRLTRSPADEGAAFGAALLGGVAAGLWPTLAAACDEAVTPGEPTDPDPSIAERLRPAMDAHARLYPLLRAEMAALSSI